MSLQQNLQQINQDWLQLNRKFSNIREQWNDDVRTQFERDYWEVIHKEMPVFLQSLEELANIILQAHTEIK